MSNPKQLVINETLVRHLIAVQFPQWKDLPIQPVALGGWDNKTFHLGDDMLVRMPSAAEYASQVEKEHRWLPILAPLLPLSIPTPLAIGQPANGCPWKWSIYRWLPGEPATTAHIANLCDFATNLAQFLTALQHINSTDGPPPGPHSFYRGGPLTIYDAETRQAIAKLGEKIDARAATKVWETAIATHWHGSPVWVHGDISAGNLLVQKGQLSAVIDFGQLSVGDPACDLAIAWTLFKDQSRETFRVKLALDDDTWNRGRAWALWKALIIAAGIANSNTLEATQALHIIKEVIADHINIKIVNNFQNKLTSEEWKAARYFRDKYFFNPNNIKDPYTWTFQQNEHVHFIFYQDNDIIGYAHIQLLPDHRAVLRIIVIDEHLRNKNSGSILLQFIERWLKNLNVKSIHAESRKTSLKFYVKNGYTEMPFNDPEGHESHPSDISVGKML